MHQVGKWRWGWLGKNFRKTKTKVYSPLCIVMLRYFLWPAITAKYVT